MSRLSRQGKILVWGIILILIAIFVIRFYVNAPAPSVTPPPTAFTVTPGKYCFSRSQTATETEPYTVEEHVVLNIGADLHVTGTKTGSQAGPDMTNGYTGTLSGTVVGTTAELTYAYTVEGSSAKELEVYEFSPNTLTKKRWNLTEQNKILVPDRVGEPKLIAYTGETCPDEATTPDTKTFTDPAKTFSFSYPPTFTAALLDQQQITNWRENTDDKGTLLAVLNIPKTFEPNTNFSDVRFTVGKSTDTNALTNCLTTTNTDTTQKENVVINGTTFTKFSFSDAGAGNFYETTSYRTIKNNECYAVEYTIHSTNLSNYPPDQGITAFDKTKVQTIAEGIVKSFKFF